MPPSEPSGSPFEPRCIGCGNHHPIGVPCRPQKVGGGTVALVVVPVLVGALIGGFLGAIMPTTSIMLTGLERLIHTALGAALGAGGGLLLGLSARAGRSG